MKYIFLILVFVFPLDGAIGGSAPVSNGSKVAAVTYVDDGGNFHATLPEYTDILGFNTPIHISRMTYPSISEYRCEAERTSGIRAREFIIQALSSATEVTLRNVEISNMGTLIADPYVDGVSLKSLLISVGLALPSQHPDVGVYWCR